MRAATPHLDLITTHSNNVCHFSPAGHCLLSCAFIVHRPPPPPPPQQQKQQHQPRGGSKPERRERTEPCRRSGKDERGVKREKHGGKREDFPGGHGGRATTGSLFLQVEKRSRASSTVQQPQQQPLTPLRFRCVLLVFTGLQPKLPHCNRQRIGGGGGSQEVLDQEVGTTDRTASCPHVGPETLSGAEP